MQQEREREREREREIKRKVPVQHGKWRGRPPPIGKLVRNKHEMIPDCRLVEALDYLGIVKALEKEATSLDVDLGRSVCASTYVC